MESCTDASYEGLGGFSVAFNFKWRLSSADLLAVGFPVLGDEPERYAPHPQGKLHINVLEFMAMFINTWVAIKLLLRKPSPPGGWVLKFLADNTSALGWIAHASRSRRDVIQNIARAYAALLTFSAPSLFTVYTDHIAGILNDAADALSRPAQFPTWSSASAQSPELGQLTAYRIPVELLSHLLCAVSGTPTEVPLELATIALRDLELNTLSTGGHRRDSQTSLSSTHPAQTPVRSYRRSRKRSRKARAS